MMIRAVCCFAFVLSTVLLVSAHELEPYFSSLKQLNFDSARHIALSEKDGVLRKELVLLRDLLFYAGQRDKNFFTLPDPDEIDRKDPTLAVVQLLNLGYHSLFYDQLKGNAYRYFHDAYKLAVESNEPVLIRPTLYALLKYFGFEIAQNSDSYLPYVQHLEKIRTDRYDDFWLTIHKLIFYSKSMIGLDNAYFSLCTTLDSYENWIDRDSPLLAYLYYERALKFFLQRDLEKAKYFYSKTIELSRPHHFLKTELFLSLIKLALIAGQEKDFKGGKHYLKEAAAHINEADTLRSRYYLNLNGSLLLGAEHKYDSAFLLLNGAYAQDFQLDFRRNTIEINRLAIELETQEKENANLKLKENRVLLIGVVTALATIVLFGYFAYTNLRAKSKVQQKEVEIQSIKMEKLIKEYELFGIDSMIEGQEKERQRIANDLHDNLGSLLAAIKLHFQNFRTKSLLDETQPDHMLQKTNDLLEEAYQKVRTIAHLKNSGVNAHDGLLPAIKKFAAKVSIVNRLNIEVKEHGINRRLENSIEITTFRILQELITNVIKHAKATDAIIHLTQHDDIINIMVEDNGVGFDQSKIEFNNSMGLYSIQKRVESLGGRVTVESVEQKGTTVIIDIPVT